MVWRDPDHATAFYHKGGFDFDGTAEVTRIFGHSLSNKRLAIGHLDHTMSKWELGIFQNNTQKKTSPNVPETFG